MEMISGLFLVLSFLVVLSVAVLLVCPESKFKKREEEAAAGLPNGSMGWPFIGETFSFLKPHKSNSIGTFLQQHCSRYGNVFKSNLFGVPTVVSGDFELNNFVLQNEDKLFQSYYPKSVKDILGKYCMMLVPGDLHKKLRTVALTFINSSKTSPHFLHYLHNLTISFMDSWNKSQHISFAKQAKKFTMHIMLKNMLNIEPGDPRATQMLEDHIAYMKGLVSIPINLPGSPYNKALKARARIQSTIKGIMLERREKNEHVLVDDDGDFLDQMLSNEECLLDNEEKVSLVMDLLLAGYETTAGLLALLVYYLFQSPEVLEQLREEHLAIRRKKKDGESLTWNDIQQMEFNTNVIYEALRCGNLVKFVHRKALMDVKYKGYYIPAGWQVLPVFTAVHMDPAIHQNPSKFDPLRWNDRSMRKIVNPFGGGMRLCPGTDLAKLEATIFLHHLVLNYRWKMVEEDYPVSYPYLGFKNGLKLELEPLENNFLDE
ncbi:putative cholesterol monooxygenase (Side-chain-cleaving) [Heracleum sosnowskyi]|uniref:Cytochrome P450 724B1 n=1 Tax=Heracleum sosnowskyi TaxID=360622 RepID=A0AAD8IE71_9APIA|nr:putative cholesterol monooxygenase (Side-chain-cleaving) [Heracleum sosnowskyi]